MPEKKIAVPATAEHQFLLDDLQAAQKRAGSATYLEAKKEFSEECYPLLQEIADHFAQRLDRVEQAMDALIDETESFLQPDLGKQILANLEIGGMLADDVMTLQAGPLDETTLARLRQAASAYLTAAEMTAEAVGGVMLDDEDTGPGQDAPGEDEGDEGEEGDEEEE